jgi:YD repeat-containing protein
MLAIVNPFSRCAAVLIVLAAATSGGACRGRSSNSGNPGSPSGPSPGGVCRTYPTSAAVAATTFNITQNLLLTGAFNPSTSTSTVTTAFVSGAPCTTSVSAYRSVADFVDEVRVIPGVMLQTSTTTTNTGACGSGMSVATFTYDAQRRLTSIASGGSMTTYTAWDGAGRPTAGSFPGTTIANVYNEATRTWTQTQTTGASVSTTTITYDANGNQLMVVNTTGPIVTTTTFTNTATAQVCK